MGEKLKVLKIKKSLMIMIVALILPVLLLNASKVSALEGDGDITDVKTIHIINASKIEIYLDNSKYSEDYGDGTLNAFIVDSGDNYDVSPSNLGIRFKNVKLENNIYTEIIIITDNDENYDIYFNGSKYSEDYGNGSLQAFIVDSGDNYDVSPQHMGIKISDASDNTRPAISGQENFVTNVDDAKPLSFFQAYLSASDETDGNLTDKIYVVSDNYTPNRSVLGTHAVTWGVKDSAGNEATLDAFIRVVDITKPVISGSSAVVRIGYKELFNIEAFRKTLTATDNYSTLTNADIKIKTDNYTANKSSLGTYNLIFNVVDSSGNEGTFTKPVQVYDNINPTFSGPLKVATSNTTILTESDVRKQLTASDEIDGNLTTKIELLEDNYSGKGNLVGSYTITYKVTDNAGNSATHQVTINRLDNLPPVIWIQDGVTIKTTPTTPLTYEQIFDTLVATNQVKVDSTTTFRVTFDEYTGNEKTPGVYALSMMTRSLSGNESVHNLAITVLETDIEDGTKEPDKKPGKVEEIWNNHQTKIIIGGVVLIAVIFIAFRFRKKK